MNTSTKKTSVNVSLNKKILSTVAISLSVAFSGTALAQVNTVHNDDKQQLLNNKSYVLPIAFENAKVELLQVNHIKHTNKIILDFDNVTNLKENFNFVKNELIEDASIQRNGKKLRLAIDVTGPVKMNVQKNLDGQFSIVVTKSSEFIVTSTLTNNVPILVEKPQSKPYEATIVNTTVVSTTKTTNVDNKPILNTKVISPIALQVPTSSLSGELTRINLKAQGKVAKLTLSLNNGSIVPNITKSGNLLIIDLPNVKIPEEFQKNTTVSELGTVVHNMDVATQKGSGRLVLSQNENWTHSLYQTDKEVVIEIKPVVKESSEIVYKGKTLTFDFQNMDIRAIFYTIADFSGLNMVLSDSVTGSMTFKLKDVPWDQALDVLLESRNLQQQKQGNVIWVATRQEVADKNKAQLELNNQAAELAPLKLEFVQLNHYKAKEMKDILEGKGNSTEPEKSISLLSKRGSVGLDVRNNKIFIQETEEKLAEINKIIRRLDMPSKQVLIEAKLVVVDDKFGRDFGAKFGFGLGKRGNSTGVGIGGSGLDATNFASGTGGQAPLNYGFNMPAANAGSIGFTILNAVTGNILSAELSALEENNRGKVISNPRLLTADNKRAEIEQGTEIPYVTPGANNSPATVAFKKAVLSLGVIPQVSPNGRVTMELEINKDTVGQLVNVQGGGQVPSIDTRKITTQVTVADGQTVVLGGIYEVSNREDLSKVPFLGDIPWVGNLFKNSTRSNQKAELLIFITPHVIYDEDLDSINKNEIKIDEIDFSKKKQ